MRPTKLFIDFSSIPLKVGKFTLFDLLLISISAFLAVAIIGFILATILRRFVRARKFKTLDRLRSIYREKLKDVIYSGNFQPEVIKPFLSVPNSLKFQAIEEVLFVLLENKKYEEEIKEMFNKLGYINYYKKQAKNKNKIIKATAIDKLGKMKVATSVEIIASQLKNQDPEIITVSLRALANIGTLESLVAILNNLPLIYEKWLVTRKAIENSILKYGHKAIPILIDFLKGLKNPKIIAIILDILSHLQDESTWPVALSFLSHDEAEVRAKALKLIERMTDKIEDKVVTKIFPLLRDPVWFVRLHAVRALSKVRNNKIHYALASSLFDHHWRVRKEAAIALANLDRGSLDIFLQALKYDDRYVKETICEEIERTNLVNRLIENLGQKNGELYNKSKEILIIMHSLNFSTPLKEYLKSGPNDKIKEEIRQILESKGVE
ncbi:MAG: HEAT repeat domain-containing protein [Candidatus Aminicenantes bacterium]|nr:HEAT repeat domain-containing protein [Candidatus Aminicenantes bacterium]